MDCHHVSSAPNLTEILPIGCLCMFEIKGLICQGDKREVLRGQKGRERDIWVGKAEERGRREIAEE